MNTTEVASLIKEVFEAYCKSFDDSLNRMKIWPWTDEKTVIHESNQVHRFLDAYQKTGKNIVTWMELPVYYKGGYLKPQLAHIDAFIVDDNRKLIFFIEAKVSEGVYFDLYVHKSKHKEDKYDASNLFFQLRSKEYFFNHECKGFEEERYKDNSFNIIKFKKGTTIDREIGANVVVNKFVEIIKECNSAYYIAIIPKQTKEIDMDKEFGFPIRFVTWEEILEKMNLYISKNINFNNKKGKNQILNNPK